MGTSLAAPSILSSRHLVRMESASDVVKVACDSPAARVKECPDDGSKDVLIRRPRTLSAMVGCNPSHGRLSVVPCRE